MLARSLDESKPAVREATPTVPQILAVVVRRHVVDMDLITLLRKEKQRMVSQSELK